MEHYIEDLEIEKDRAKIELEDHLHFASAENHSRETVKDLERLLEEREEAIANLREEKEYFISNL